MDVFFPPLVTPEVYEDRREEIEFSDGGIYVWHSLRLMLLRVTGRDSEARSRKWIKGSILGGLLVSLVGVFYGYWMILFTPVCLLSALTCWLLLRILLKGE